MTTYYCGIGGNDASDGTSWANRRLTLNASEDLLTANGDVLYVGPGTYRETWTLDKSGAAGQPLTAIGDYTGANTDGVGGVVRITGSDDDLSATRTRCIYASAARTHRTFRGFTLDFAAQVVEAVNPATWIIEQCHVSRGSTKQMTFSGASQAAVTVRNCYIYGYGTGHCVEFTHSATVDDAGHVVENCIMRGTRNTRGVNVERVGGITIRNCLFDATGFGPRVAVALAAGQTVTVNNCVMQRCIDTALTATVAGELVENYNALSSNAADRSNVNVGAQSITTPYIFDCRWFHEAVNGGRFVTPFDMASYCALVEVADNAPTATDMRGSSMVGAEREIGALEYDATLLIESAAGGGILKGDKRGGKQ